MWVGVQGVVSLKAAGVINICVRDLQGLQLEALRLQAIYAVMRLMSKHCWDPDDPLTSYRTQFTKESNP